ncbi:hypothetical protein ACFP8W_05610 [Nocardioides hankookensis]
MDDRNVVRRDPVADHAGAESGLQTLAIGCQHHRQSGSAVSGEPVEEGGTMQA